MDRRLRVAVCVAIMLGFVGGAQAGVFRDAVRGLEYAGFQFAGQTNPLSGGAEFGLARNFQGETLDFGSTELTLSGPVQFTFETGGRLLPVLDIALSAGVENNPLQYSLVSDVGGQSTTVNGSLVLDGTGSINTFGFYDFTFQLSSRQNITQEGRFQNADGEEVDFDIGPINVSGNLFADMLASLFDPLFASTGQPNLFASFSGRLQAEEELNRRVAAARSKMQQGVNLSASEVSDIVGRAMATQAMGGDVPDLSFLNIEFDSGGTGLAVPEPPTLLLLGAVIPLLRGRRR